MAVLYHLTTSDIETLWYWMLEYLCFKACSEDISSCAKWNQKQLCLTRQPSVNESFHRSCNVMPVSGCLVCVLLFLISRCQWLLFFLGSIAEMQVLLYCISPISNLIQYLYLPTCQIPDTFTVFTCIYGYWTVSRKRQHSCWGLIYTSLIYENIIRPFQML